MWKSTRSRSESGGEESQKGKDASDARWLLPPEACEVYVNLVPWKTARKASTKRPGHEHSLLSTSSFAQSTPAGEEPPKTTTENVLASPIR